MLEFSKKKKDLAEDKGKSKNFLSACKDDHAALFEDFVARADEFESGEELVAELQAAAWELCERVAKQSYRNGIARGRGDRSRG